ncbi:MAG: low molecular weight phosphatase family protein [Candidatus Nanohaloarchaea archaeon]|nr:low molecular weight phosphatase family protein [Candidatus Nanohaloarchaea archaeon]
MKVAILSKRNSGRSLMAYAFFVRELHRRQLETAIDVVVGGTDPAGTVQEEVRRAMQETDLDITGIVPREMEEEDLADADVLITIGFEASSVNVEGFDAENVVWRVPSTEGESLKQVRKARDAIEEKVQEFLDEYGS